MENKCPVKFQKLDFCAPATHENPYEMYDYFLEHEPIRSSATPRPSSTVRAYDPAFPPTRE
ncbi:MAG: hypothetical protein JRH14_14985 [Deltaproteobacteria bacterium]|nr:hypothetical protein [Deltaproteobacteria bacterium]